MKSITRLTRSTPRLSDLSLPTSRLILTSSRPLHTTPPARADEELTTPQKIRKRIWGDPGPADPYAPLTPEERERREIAQLEAEEAEREEKKSEERKAAREKKSKERIDEGYVPDYDARSMIVVGTRGAFMKREFDPKNKIMRYLQKRLTEQEEITAAVRRAVVEACTLAIASSNPGLACVTYKGPEYLTDRVSIITEDGGRNFKFDFKSPKILRRIEEYAKNKQPLKADEEIVEAIPKDEGDGWMRLTLGEPGLKFAIIKRSMQLTGIPLTDPIINDISTVKDLLHKFHQIASQTQTKKLAPALAENEELSEIPNVAVHQYQFKFTDKERALGRLETIPIMMAGRVRREGELIGRGVGRDGRKRVTRSMLRLRARKMKAYGVSGIERFRYDKRNPREGLPPIDEETGAGRIIDV
ncbi:hypothetical protein ABW19_dt0204841 [Dactylella cylindrospora]|nr:hypothetical protein ABW19_dt0204841 [Dactylella cylindrospora]